MKNEKKLQVGHTHINFVGKMSSSGVKMINYNLFGKVLFQLLVLYNVLERWVTLWKEGLVFGILKKKDTSLWLVDISLLDSNAHTYTHNKNITKKTHTHTQDDRKLC